MYFDGMTGGKGYIKGLGATEMTEKRIQKASPRWRSPQLMKPPTVHQLCVAGRRERKRERNMTQPGASIPQSVLGAPTSDFPGIGTGAEEINTVVNPRQVAYPRTESPTDQARTKNNADLPTSTSSSSSRTYLHISRTGVACSSPDRRRHQAREKSPEKD